mmetsp:Transcript_11489/g.12420  ORF Transcript_11489/g.12420 Transcript_11489/m.12420 type:complete len:217 (+) Transcript_11489:180-830(+)
MKYLQMVLLHVFDLNHDDFLNVHYLYLMNYLLHQRKKHDDYFLHEYLVNKWNDHDYLMLIMNYSMLMHQHVIHVIVIHVSFYRWYYPISVSYRNSYQPRSDYLIMPMILMLPYQMSQNHIILRLWMYMLTRGIHMNIMLQLIHYYVTNQQDLNNNHPVMMVHLIFYRVFLVFYALFSFLDLDKMIDFLQVMQSDQSHYHDHLCPFPYHFHVYRLHQ